MKDPEDNQEPGPGTKLLRTNTTEVFDDNEKKERKKKRKTTDPDSKKLHQGVLNKTPDRQLN